MSAPSPTSPGPAAAPDWGALRMAMNDPLNRLYRYPLSQWAARLLRRTPLTANMVTVGHTAVGLFAAWAAAQGQLALSAAAYEARNVLDCLDGDLARLKGQCSRLGLALDMVGDSLAFVAWVGGILWHLDRTAPALPVRQTLPAALLCLGASALLGLFWDWNRAAITAAGEGRRRPRLARLATRAPGRARLALQALGFASGDLCVDVLIAGLLLQRPFEALWAVAAFGAAALALGLPLSRRLLGAEA